MMASNGLDALVPARPTLETMYEAYFGFSRPPFAETVDPARWVALASREAALRRVRFAVEHTRGPALVYGPAGAGK